MVWVSESMEVVFMWILVYETLRRFVVFIPFRKEDYSSSAVRLVIREVTPKFCNDWDSTSALWNFREWDDFHKRKVWLVAGRNMALLELVKTSTRRIYYTLTDTVKL